MATFTLRVLACLLLLGAAEARSVDAEKLQAALKDTDYVLDNDACQDCIQIIELLKHLMTDQQFQEDSQAKLKSGLEELCDELPGEIPKMCRAQVERYLPLALSFITGLMNPKDVCSYFGLCNGQLRRQMEDLLKSHMQRSFEIPTIMLNSSIPCTICTYVVDMLDCVIPKTQTLIITLLGDVCNILPPLIRGQCNMIVKRYVKMLIDVLLSFISPDSICTTLHLCQNMDASEQVSVFSDCESCLALVVLTRLHLGPNTTDLQSDPFLRSICQSHPGVLLECETFTQRHGNQLQGLLGKDMPALEMCERADLCGRRDRGEPVVPGDPCSLGPSYHCRDLQTAETCGVVSFCQKNVWN